MFLSILDHRFYLFHQDILEWSVVFLGHLLFVLFGQLREGFTISETPLSIDTLRISFVKLSILFLDCHYFDIATQFERILSLALTFNT